MTRSLTVSHHGYHATLLQLFGLTPSTLVFRQGPQERAILSGEGRVVKEVLARPV